MCISFPGIVVAVDADGAVVETEGRRRRASTLFPRRGRPARGLASRFATLGPSRAGRSAGVRRACPADD